MTISIPANIIHIIGEVTAEGINPTHINGGATSVVGNKRLMLGLRLRL